MDLSVRDWLVIIGALLALAVLLDGFRRMRNERRDTLRLSAKKRRDEEDVLINPELPGAARVVAVRETPHPSLHTKHAPSPTDDDTAEPGGAKFADQRESPDDILFSDPAEEYGRAPTRGPVDQRSQLSEDIDSFAPKTPVVNDSPSAARDTRAKVAQKPKRARDSSDEQPSAVGEELFVIKVMADSAKPYLGQDLLQVLLACDLRYGRMNIFHRYENADGTGAEQFSVANLIEPGSFELDAIDDFSTPGVVFFMTLPGPEKSMEAFEAMLETARCLVKNLGGSMRDQSHSVATKQTFEHYRQRIRDFERRQLTLM